MENFDLKLWSETYIRAEMESKVTGDQQSVNLSQVKSKYTNKTTFRLMLENKVSNIK